MNLYYNLLKNKANEAITLEKLIIPILRMANFDTEDFSMVEEEYKLKNSNSSIEVDRMLKISGSAICAVQAKRIGDTYSLKNDIHKTIPYIIDNGVLFDIFTDGIEWRFYQGYTHLRTFTLLNGNIEDNRKNLANFIIHLLKGENEYIN